MYKWGGSGFYGLFIPAPAQEPIIEAAHVTRTFGKGSSAVHALRGANLCIAPGRLVALRGRSGSGKTTPLNMLGALDRPTEGAIYYRGQEMSGWPDKKRNEFRRTQLGLIFQSFALVPFMSAYENVEFGLRIAGIASGKRREYAEQALEFVGLKARMKHRPYEMSGGEQLAAWQLLELLLTGPPSLLADEPTAELDSKMGSQVMKVFKDLVHQEGMTIILTTHDPAIMEIVDQVYALEDGHIVEE